MTDVPWTTMEPGTTEKVIAVMLCRRHPNARRIRPSRGDGGLDVVVAVGPGGLVDVDQIKYFSQSPTSSQKRQIRDSLAAALATHRGPDSGYTIRQWHLTMPLDPTREFEAWLRETADELGVPFPVTVRGKVFVESLVTTYPEVVDYYVHDGAARVNQLIADLSNMAGLVRRDDAGNRIEPEQADAPLRALHQALNRDDPHFRYEFQVSDGPPPMIARPMLVCSAANCGPDGYVTWHVFAKYDEFHLDRPVPLNLTFRPDQMTDQQRADWTSAMTYGTDVELEGDGVVEVELDLPAGLGHTREISLLKLGPAVPDTAEPTRARWTIKAPDGHDIASLLLEFDETTSGPHGGERRVGHDLDRLLEVELRSHFDQYGNPVELPRIALKLISTEVFRGVPAQRALPIGRFLAAWRAGNGLFVAPEFGDNSVKAATIPGDFAGPVWLPPLLEALAAIGQSAGRALPLPGLGEVDPARLGTLYLVADVLNGHEPEVRFASAVVPIPDGDVDDFLVSAAPRRIAYPLPSDIAGTPVSLPPAVLVINGALASVEGPAYVDGLTLIALTTTETTQAKIVLEDQLTTGPDESPAA